MAGYDAYHWKKFSNMDSDFVYEHMKGPSFQQNIWYQLGHIPSSIVMYSRIFRTLPDLISGKIYKDPQNTGKCCYVSNGASTPTYYMALKVWSTETLPIPQDGDAITSRENGMVYISTHTNIEYKDLYAAVLTKFKINSTRSHLTLALYTRPDTDSNFTATSTTYDVGIPVYCIDTDGSYYMPCNSTGLAYRLYYINCTTINVLANYDPLNWKTWEEVSDMFE
jgi:hypothetical protein